jgi:glycosyltransferase involved in cell wall biosynthesis
MDAWPETFERVLPRRALFLMRLVAKGNYLAADGISAVTKSYLSLAAGYGARCPMLLCHHGIRIPADSGPDRKPAAPDPDRIRLAYAGNMSLSYDLATVVDAVKADSALSLDLAGSGPDEPSLRARAADCPRIRFHGYLDDAGLRSMLAQADVGVVPMFDDSCVGVPYKLADYAAAGLPVTSSLHGETAELLEECAAGVTYAARDPAAFSSAVRRATAIGTGGMRLARRFDAERLYREYVEFACGRAMRPDSGE